ncbi:MAG: AbrB/MazE/SpoVT family DNA-binding domain-containing protein [Candidatus Sungbacteria bacterium]|uniref:AbrB/MazE/SpoVT family DNA-binding domain-containing protein n=1 Tax=Candidatus Sungiibacteriota bacterium TaxID=2750080 RepID=A0A931WPE2_9BACT|nr:AbrB/MazE/SpoVT family DNA-binding domain-containing protein [Candidatus Sungbacteria bacterium]
MSTKFKSPFGGKHKFYGSTTVGTRGQVVIPIKARRNFRLKAGEELLVSGAHGRFLVMMKISEVKGLMEELAVHVKEFQHILTKTKKS